MVVGATESDGDSASQENGSRVEGEGSPLPDGLGDHLEEYIRLHQQKKELQKKERDVQDRMRELEPVIRDALLERGLQNVKTSGTEDVPSMTVYIHSQKWASPKNGDNRRAVEVLQEFGYEEMVRPISSSVSTLFRGDPERVQEEIPDAILEAFEVTEKVSVRVRKA